MTYKQAQLYIKIFILQNYDKNIQDVIPDVDPMAFGKVSELRCDYDGDWCTNKSYFFFANAKSLKRYNNIRYSSYNEHESWFKKFDHNLYINTKEET